MYINTWSPPFPQKRWPSSRWSPPRYMYRGTCMHRQACPPTLNLFTYFHALTSLPHTYIYIRSTLSPFPPALPHPTHSHHRARTHASATVLAASRKRLQPAPQWAPSNQSRTDPRSSGGAAAAIGCEAGFPRTEAQDGEEFPCWWYWREE